ncbi:MAG: hypothetical protein WAQ74_07805 [Kiritimatiellia bacterium]
MAQAFWRGIYENVNISSNARIRFYAVANRQDTDGDGLTDSMEIFVHHTHPELSDTDGDTIPDGAEISLGLNPLDAADAELDPDNDHLVNREEYELGLPMTISNEVTMVYYQSRPAAPGKSTRGPGTYIYLTPDNLEAKAVATRRQKEGYPEYTNALLPPSDPPKWYLSKERMGVAVGAANVVLPYSGGRETYAHSVSNYCFTQCDPFGWPSEPTNHLCAGYENCDYRYSSDDSTYHWWSHCSFTEPSTNVPVYEHAATCGSSGCYTNDSTAHTVSCYVEPWVTVEPYSHTEAYRSNNFDSWIEFFASVTNDTGYEVARETLTNEYTDEILHLYTELDLEQMSAWSDLDWGERRARTNHHEDAYVEPIPSNEIYSACLISDKHDDLLFQDLQYRWTMPTTSGTVYKFLWLEAFRPQGSDTYSDFKLMSDVFIGTGDDMQTKIYEAGRPREHWDDPYGTIEPIGLLVLLECDLAVTRQMGFGADPPELVCYPVWGDETDAARYDQIKYNAALTVLFSAASTPAGDPVNFNVTLHVYPEDLPGVTWAKTDGPDSGTLLNSEQPVATYANPAKGGLYTFTTTVPGAQPITSQLWLPVSGPDISTNFQEEIEYLTNWKPMYRTNLHQRILADLGWQHIENPLQYHERKWEIMRDDIRTIGPGFDYMLASQSLLQHVCGLSHVRVTNQKAKDSARLVLAGNTRPYVTDFAKRNNMGYAMCARAMGWPQYAILLGPNFSIATGNTAAGSWDGPDAIAAYHAGIHLMDGAPLRAVMDAYGRSMQNPGMRLSREWPSDEVTSERYIALTNTLYDYLNHLAGGKP